MSERKFQIGDHVRKIGGRYGGPGRIVGDTMALDDDGYKLWNVEHKIEGGYGKFCHVYPSNALEPAAAPVAELVTPAAPTPASNGWSPKTFPQVWQHIATAPRDGTFVLTKAGRRQPCITHFATYDGRARWGASPEGFVTEEEFLRYWHEVSYEPTEWMPLPDDDVADAIETAYRNGFVDGEQHASENAAPPAPPTPAKGYQQRVAAAHHALFHDDPTDIEERRNRFAEEVNETLQAFGMTEDEAVDLVRYTWSRPVGQPEKEVGAALLTLASLCVVAGIDMAACGEADLEKLQQPETIARIRAKRATRHGRGPLPGLDPATTEGRNDG